MAPTIDGKAELVVQDAASHQRLSDRAERLGTIQALMEGPASADRGEGRPMDDVFPAQLNGRETEEPHFQALRRFRGPFECPIGGSRERARSG